MGNLKKKSSINIRDSVSIIKNKFTSKSSLKAVKEDDLDSVGDNDNSKIEMGDNNSDRHFLYKLNQIFKFYIN